MNRYERFRVLSFSTRGSILLVILVSSFAMIIVLALSTLSSININMARSRIEHSQAQLAAQGALQQFFYELDKRNQYGTNSSDFVSPEINYDLKKRYQNTPALPGRCVPYTEEVIITFDQNKAYFSTDNLSSESTARGWCDRNSSVSSIPPFSVDLVITVKSGGSVKHFEALIGHQWPFAAYCARAPIIITSMGLTGSQKLRTGPSTINGDILSCYNPRILEFITHSEYGISPNEFNQNDLGFYSNIEFAAIPDFSVKLGGVDTIDIGNSIKGNIYTSAPKNDRDPIVVDENSQFTGHKYYRFGRNADSSKKDPISLIRIPEKNTFTTLNPENIPEIKIMGAADVTTLSEGDCFNWTTSIQKAQIFIKEVQTWMALAMNGSSQIPQELLSEVEPVLKKYGNPKKEITSADYLTIRTTVMKYLYKTKYGYACFLKKPLALNGDSQTNKFYLRGNLSNHYVNYRTTSSPCISITSYLSTTDDLGEEQGNAVWSNETGHFSKAGLVLRDCTLYVDGDVELLEYGSSENTMQSDEDAELSSQFKPMSIDGKNATLIVSGNLKIMGGNLDSRDKGMVIYAQNIELSTRGSFNGLILSSGAIEINPYPEKNKQSSNIKEYENLKIRGALACNGIISNEINKKAVLAGLSLKSVDLAREPRYTKILNQFGIPCIILWREIKQ